jgi:hypothetical protein
MPEYVVYELNPTLFVVGTGDPMDDSEWDPESDWSNERDAIARAFALNCGLAEPGDLEF